MTHKPMKKEIVLAIILLFEKSVAIIYISAGANVIINFRQNKALCFAAGSHVTSFNQCFISAYAFLKNFMTSTPGPSFSMLQL